MTTDQSAAINVKTKPADISCEKIPARALRRRAFGLPVALFMAALTVDVASAQTIANGGIQTGTLALNTTNSYTFSANAGDSINLRVGTTNFDGNLQLFGPTSALLTGTGGSTDDLITYSATNSGTFTVRLSSWFAGGSGTYALYLAQMPEAFTVPSGDQGGPMTNGGKYPGTITLGDLDMWTFTANTGDNINLRVGTTNFDGKLQLYGTNGALVASTGGATDDLIAYTATNSGTFTVLVSSWFSGETGTYALYLAQTPEAFIVPAGDQGGPMTNGGKYPGTISLGDLDMWSFTASTGDSINLRVGTTNFDGKLQLYGTNGALVASTGGATDDLIAYTATNSGTFTVLVSSWFSGETGTYALYLAQTPEAFIVPIGDAGGLMTNGGKYAGTTALGEIDMWSFTANTGDSINLRVGTTGFDGYLELYGPNGALLAHDQGVTDDSIAYSATNSGTFTVLVSSWFQGGTGTYNLFLAQIPEPFIVPPGDAGGLMTNGGKYAGTTALGEIDMWRFTANTGDSINLRVGTTGFDGYLELYGPNGALLAHDQGVTDDLVAYTATNSGTFTVLVSSWFQGGTGTYNLFLAQIPEPFIVPPGDAGGRMTNGGNYPGTISLGEMDMWTFSASAKDSINLRVGTTGFDGYLELYGPNGALLADTEGVTDDPIAYTATNSGTFTVLVSSWFSGGTGTYALFLAQMPESFIVPPGDAGGAMTGGTRYNGTLSLGDLDMWSFTACKGEVINLGLNTTNFDGKLQLYGSNGALLDTAGGTTVTSFSYTATNCGDFRVLVSSWFDGGTGAYGLSANGLLDGMRVCPPAISGANLTVNGIGGPTNALFILYSATNLATPANLWTPILTNHFDLFGVLTYTNVYNPVQELFFRFVVP